MKAHDERLEHAKLLDAGPLATHLDDSAILWANREMTDGFVPTRQVRRLVDWHGVFVEDSKGKPKPVDPMKLAARLVEVKRWEKVDGGYRIHDYLKHQRSKEKILEDRARGAVRQADWRERNRGTNGGSNAATNGRGNAVSNAVTNRGGHTGSAGGVTGALEERGKSGELHKGQRAVSA